MHYRASIATAMLAVALSAISAAARDRYPDWKDQPSPDLRYFNQPRK